MAPVEAAAVHPATVGRERADHPLMLRTQLAPFVWMVSGALSTACAIPPTRNVVHATEDVSRAAGYLSHGEAFLDPFCHAVQIESDVVLTAAGCARPSAPTWLSFAVEARPDSLVGVDHILGAPARDEPLVRLRLVGAPPHGSPARVRTGADGVSVGDVVTAVAFIPTPRREGPPRPYRWTAEVTETDAAGFVAELLDGAPACHGELGVAVFEAGDLVGVLIGTTAGGPEHPISSSCVTRYRFARPPVGTSATPGAT